MNRARFTPALTLTAGLIGLLTIANVPLFSQPADTRTEAAVVAYDRTHEITVSGTIQGVVAKPESGSPSGLHLLVNGSEGTFDAALGPYMAKETREALRAGAAVQIVGAIEKVHGRQYLLARQVSFDGRTVTVRNLNGALLMVQSPRGPHRNADYVRQPEVNGGAR